MEFIAQYPQHVHAAAEPAILDTATASVFENAARLGILSTTDAEVLHPAMRLYHDLGQSLRLCLIPRASKSVAPGLVALLAYAADLPGFVTLKVWPTGRHGYGDALGRRMVEGNLLMTTSTTPRFAIARPADYIFDSLYGSSGGFFGPTEIMVSLESGIYPYD